MKMKQAKTRKDVRRLKARRKLRLLHKGKMTRKRSKMRGAGDSGLGTALAQAMGEGGHLRGY